MIERTPSPRRAGLFCVAVAALAWLACHTVGFAQTAHVHDSSLPHNIPNLCAAATIKSVASGRWSDPGIWSTKRLPANGDLVVVAASTVVTYDRQSDEPLACVGVSGTLKFDQDLKTRLKVGTLMVMPEGYLEIGTERQPVGGNASAEIVIADRPIDLTNDPEQYGTGLIGLGRIRIHGVPKVPTFSRLTREIATGARNLPIQDRPRGWMPGDRLIVPDSKQWAIESGRPYVPEWETPTVSAISESAVTVDALKFDHPGARNGDDTIEFLPHVGNLSRNVIVRSENPSGTRGHVIFVARADVDVRYALFKDLGRTTIAPLNNTTFSGSRVTNVGTNQLGRYSLHMHHVVGPQQPPQGGYQYTLIGNALDGGLKWGITIHDSHYGLVKDNVVYDFQGVGVMTEDGSESYNVIEHNFVVRVRGTGAERADRRQDTNDWGYEGSAFWFRGPNNVVRDNVAANTNSFGYAYVHLGVKNVDVPKSAGSDKTRVTDMTLLPLREFARNELYAAVNGLTLWNVMASCCTRVFEGPESLIRDFRAWHISRYGMYNYGMNHVTFDGWVQRGDKRVLANSHEFLIGLWFDDYPARNVIVRRADIQNLRTGIAVPAKPGDVNDIYGSQPGTLLIEDSLLRNHNNVLISTMYAVTGGGPALPPRQTIIRNVTFKTVSGPVGDAPQHAIAMRFRPRGNNLNLIQRDEVSVENYNGVAGDTFRVYYLEQAPAFVIPNNLGRVTRSPVAGLTNQESWKGFGIAIGGAVAPCSQTRPEIQGFVCSGTPLPSPQAPPRRSSPGPRAPDDRQREQPGTGSAGVAK